MLSLALANAKGGTGKTSLAVHLAEGLARKGRRVVLADLDPQGNATSWLLGELPTGPGSAEALTGRLTPAAVRPVPARPRLGILPATPALGGAEYALASEVAGETLLRRALAGLKGNADAVVMDCPPNMGVAVLSALVASNAVLVPLLPAFLSLAAVARLEEMVERVTDRLGAKTSIVGVVLFAADRREAITAESREILRRELGERLYRSEVRISTAAKALPARQQTAWDDGADPRGAEDYAAVLRETLARVGK